MPITIDDTLPARAILENENIFVMSRLRATHQDIRPLKIIVLNLMPNKPETEVQLFRCLSNTPLQIEIELLQASTHVSKNTSPKHLLTFYKTFDQVKDNRYDGMIITGAPVEHLDFEHVDYWEELCEIMDWSTTNVYSTFHICWGAQAALYHHYGIVKHPIAKKVFGVFWHSVTQPKLPLMRGFDERFLAPHSRHTEIKVDDVLSNPDLNIISMSDKAGVYIVLAREGRQIFVTGHSEYDAHTLANEYYRDISKGLPIEIPANYFPGNDPAQIPTMKWRAHANLLYSNWLNYYVYQSTPYDLDELE